MKSRFRTAGALIIAGTMAGLLAACSTSDDPSSTPIAEDCVPAHGDIETLEPGVLTIGAYNYPPFVAVDGDTLTGAEGEALMELAAMECLTPRVLEGTEGSVTIEMVKSGRADVTLGSFYRTAERAEVVRLGAPVYQTTLAMVSTQDVETFDDLQGLTVGAANGFLSNDALKELYGDDFKIYESIGALYADLAAGRVDVVFSGVGPAFAQLELHPVPGAEVIVPPSDERVPATLSPGQTNFITSYDNETLGAALDEDITTLREDGTLEELVVKYQLPVEVAYPDEPNLL